ncbi:hypothetical protein T440DRAFT_402592 [Plenodomus tracheiphilus IPT5]|uniref:Xylanolytic transcriptional activator regulatory domain-containing protein n=1 Tax=Plenodomus tracheiphilus IPT5 TaxID=1408161 RepID=A0A6A7B0C5_9PLEO|nr:hypothetical protein T440DRAFT_402592 [Plenodomus tracheiphilus IPT5]
MGFNLINPQISAHIYLGRPNADQNALASFDDQPDLLESYQLPPQVLLEELVKLFFDNFYHMFPCFHRASFEAKVRSSELATESPLLIYAMCCISARHHTESVVHARERCWYEQAKFHYEITRRRPDAGLRTVQSVLLLVFHASTIGDYSASWLFLGKAWRQAVVLGLNRMDATRAVVMDLDHPNVNAGNEIDRNTDTNAARTMLEREECRRTLWLLFIMDRTQAWPTGWPHAIAESQFKVDMPMADTIFQAAVPDMAWIAHDTIPFSKNINSLIATLGSAKHPLNVFHYLVVAHVLLGRVAELVHSLHDDPGTPEYADDCAELDALIIRFRLNIPRQASSVIDALPCDQSQVVWLHVTLNTMEMLLHYRTCGNASTPGEPPKFKLAVNAARNIAQLIKDASRISNSLLVSAHIGSSLYVAACILVIQWRLTGDDSLKNEIDLFMLVFQRMNDVYSFLGLKFKIALEKDLERSVTDLASLRERGYKGLLADCSKWEFVREAFAQRGIPLDIT